MIITTNYYNNFKYKESVDEITFRKLEIVLGSDFVKLSEKDIKNKVERFTILEYYILDHCFKEKVSIIQYNTKHSNYAHYYYNDFISRQSYYYNYIYNINNFKKILLVENKYHSVINCLKIDHSNYYLLYHLFKLNNESGLIIKY